MYLKQVLRIFNCFSVSTVRTFPARDLLSFSPTYIYSSLCQILKKQDSTPYCQAITLNGLLGHFIALALYVMEGCITKREDKYSRLPYPDPDPPWSFSWKEKKYRDFSVILNFKPF